MKAQEEITKQISFQKYEMKKAQDDIDKAKRLALGLKPATVPNSKNKTMDQIKNNHFRGMKDLIYIYM